MEILCTDQYSVRKHTYNQHGHLIRGKGEDLKSDPFTQKLIAIGMNTIE